MMDVMELRPYDVALTALLVSALRRDPERDAVDIDHDPTNTGHLAKVLHEEVEGLWTAQERSIAGLASRVEVMLGQREEV